MDLLLPILERFGFPAAVVAAGLLLGWRLSRWFGNRIAEPLIASHVGVIQSLERTNEINTQTLQAQAGTFASQTTLLQQITAIQEKQMDQLERLQELLTRQWERQDAA